MGSKYGNVLRREVQHLPELHFLLPNLVLSLLALGDIDYRAHKFNEMTRRAQERMTHDVNVPDRAIRRHDAVFRPKLYLLADSRLNYLLESWLIVGVKALN